MGDSLLWTTRVVKGLPGGDDGKLLFFSILFFWLFFLLPKEFPPPSAYSYPTGLRFPFFELSRDRQTAPYFDDARQRAPPHLARARRL
jgi:hypothetical protein